MRVLITAGPTRERIDAVRFLSNRSTGKMGYALAEAAHALGCDVTLVSGPVALAAPEGVRLIRVESAREMADAVLREAPEMGLIVMAAAVADYRPVETFAGKLKKQPGKLVLELERTEDILASLGARKVPGQILVGFAAETDALISNASGKLAKKNLDWIAANDVSRSDIGFGSPDNAVSLLARDGRRFDFGPAPKRKIAELILKTVMAK